MHAVTAYGLPWHTLHSRAFHEILIDPLRPYAAIPFVGYTRTAQREIMSAASLGARLIFCQIVPPRAVRNDPRAHVIWIPMWDQVRLYGQAWWNTLPKHLRIVAYSDAIAMRAEAAGLPTLRVRYFVDPSSQRPAPWDGERVGYYWNRTGLLGPSLLIRVCQALALDRLIIKPHLDPGASPRAYFDLPARIGATTVETLSEDLDRAAYLERVHAANIVIAPRVTEGVGLVMLEGLARGCAVLAYDAPTMNEYIRHDETGYLFRARAPWDAEWPALARRALHRLRGLSGRWYFRHPLREEDQDWDALGALDLPGIGAAARAANQAGRVRWLADIPRLAQFILE